MGIIFILSVFSNSDEKPIHSLNLEPEGPDLLKSSPDVGCFRAQTRASREKLCVSERSQWLIFLNYCSAQFYF